MRKIKVINIISDSNIGGAGKCILTFFKTYDKSRFDMAVIVPEESKLINELKAVGARVIEAKGIADKSLSLSAIFSLYSILRHEMPDVVHTHGAMSARIASRLACGLRTKLVYTRHCVYEPSNFMKGALGRFIGWFTDAVFSDYAIAVAQAAKDNLTDVGVPRVKVVLNGIEPLKPKTSPMRQQLGIAENCRVVSIVARLEEVKGHIYFIEAAKKVLAQAKNVVFVIAGTGTIHQELEAKVKENGLENGVIFTGFLPDVSGLFNITYINVNASFGTEATSLSLLEGMSLGIPAVVTNYGGNPGVISDGENGIIMPIKSSEALAEAILSLLNDSGYYNKLSKGAVEIFNKRFTNKAMTKELENIYAILANERGRG